MTKRTWVLAIVGLVVFYLVSHLISLTLLPVFADEAIYIHWAQVAYAQPKEYAFLSMLDGKPPLHIWLLIPFVKYVSDPLFGGRLLSVLLGLATMFFMKALIRLLGGQQKEQLLGMLIVAIAPFWFFYQRMALAESLLALCFLSGLYFGLKLVSFSRAIRVSSLEGKPIVAPVSTLSLIITLLAFGLSFGAALWTKTTALFFIPVYAALPLFYVFTERHYEKRFMLRTLFQAYMQRTTFFLCVGGVVGGVLFLLLRFSPLFPFLFTRSADYTFTLKEMFDGEWRFVLFRSLPSVIFWIALYITPFLCVPLFFGGKKNTFFFFLFLCFVTPLLAFGKVLSSRYFLPGMVLLTIMAVQGFSLMMMKQRQKLASLCFKLFVLISVLNIGCLLVDPSTGLYTQEDRQQYLTEWSSGYGIPEVRDFFLKKMQQQEVTVGTEGYFGTLPDGLSIYFMQEHKPHDIHILGVGQPIHEIPTVLLEAAQKQETYLVVNASRFFVTDTTHYERVAAYSRPYNGSQLLLLRILP